MQHLKLPVARLAMQRLKLPVARLTLPTLHWKIVLICSVPLGSHLMSHRNVQPHVSINEVACCRTERNTVGGTSDTPTPTPHTLFLRVRSPISVLELTKNEVDG